MSTHSGAYSSCCGARRRDQQKPQSKPHGLVAVGYRGRGPVGSYKDCSVWLSALLWIFVIVVFIVMVAAIAQCAARPS